MRKIKAPGRFNQARQVTDEGPDNKQHCSSRLGFWQQPHPGKQKRTENEKHKQQNWGPTETLAKPMAL